MKLFRKQYFFIYDNFFMNKNTLLNQSSLGELVFHFKHYLPNLNSSLQLKIEKVWFFRSRIIIITFTTISPAREPTFSRYRGCTPKRLSRDSKLHQLPTTKHFENPSIIFHCSPKITNNSKLQVSFNNRSRVLEESLEVGAQQQPPPSTSSPSSSGYLLSANFKTLLGKALYF